MKTVRIAITPGEPAGIGPDLVLQIAQQKFAAELVVIADRELLEQRAKQIGVPIQLYPCDFTKPPQRHRTGELKIIHVPLAKKCIAGKLDKANANYVIETLEIAAQNAIAKKVDAIVTAPVHKAIINEAGIPFSGHTEFFAEKTQSQVVMILVAKKMRVALVTTHLPIAKVAQAITAEKLETVVKILHHDLLTRFNIKNPNIFVAGLNPHAGESGHIGREEIEIIEPTLNKLRKQGMQLQGPLPADTLFLPKYLQQADAFLAMYHDQGLPVLKFYDFDNAVNVTLGMPIIRTSVDHGTALELAGKGKADTSSLIAALKMAIAICKNSMES